MFSGENVQLAPTVFPCIHHDVIIRQLRTPSDTILSAYMTHTGTFAQLNEDALKFLELCDGTNTIEDVAFLVVRSERA